jgi:hypothetical protein
MPEFRLHYALAEAGVAPDPPRYCRPNLGSRTTFRYPGSSFLAESKCSRNLWTASRDSDERTSRADFERVLLRRVLLPKIDWNIPLIDFMASSTIVGSLTASQHIERWGHWNSTRG